MSDKTLACGEENPTTYPRLEECNAAGASVETENPFGSY
jgi:hypothetical protein